MCYTCVSNLNLILVMIYVVYRSNLRRRWKSFSAHLMHLMDWMIDLVKVAWGPALSERYVWWTSQIGAVVYIWIFMMNSRTSLSKNICVIGDRLTVTVFKWQVSRVFIIVPARTRSPPEPFTRRILPHMNHVPPGFAGLRLLIGQHIPILQRLQLRKLVQSPHQKTGHHPEQKF